MIANDALFFTEYTVNLFRLRATPSVASALKIYIFPRCLRGNLELLLAAN